MTKLAVTLAAGMLSLATIAHADVSRPKVYPVQNIQLVAITPPAYPDLARKAGIEGRVVVNVQVDADGKVTKAAIVESSNPLFNDVALHAALTAKYTAATMPTGPVKTWAQIPFNFKQQR